MAYACLDMLWGHRGLLHAAWLGGRQMVFQAEGISVFREEDITGLHYTQFCNFVNRLYAST